jgi:hypothetical protein
MVVKYCLLVLLAAPCFLRAHSATPGYESQSISSSAEVLSDAILARTQVLSDSTRINGCSVAISLARRFDYLLLLKPAARATVTSATAASCSADSASAELFPLLNGRQRRAIPRPEYVEVSEIRITGDSARVDFSVTRLSYGYTESHNLRRLNGTAGGWQVLGIQISAIVVF